MTETTSAPPEAGANHEGNDQVPGNFAYGHGRMPFFMKVVWTGFLVLATWYTVKYLLASVATELGG